MDLYLGWSIDVSGDSLIAGSWNRSDLTRSSATVFVRTSTDSNLDWEQQGEPLVVDDGEDGSYYGYRVAIDGDTALISATKTETQEARLFVFERSDGVWEQTKMLHSGGFDDGNILRIALDGDTGE
jgi:predicted SPOUT superfamily RNA methylase MTH1